MKKALFIINPECGTQNFWKDVEGIIGCLTLNEIINHADVHYTRKQYDAREAARKLKPGQYDVIVAVGGDGTVSDVVNGIMLGGCHTPIAILPVGTSNVFATTLGLPLNKEDFCLMLRKFETRDIDVGRINTQYFISTVGGGLASDIGYRAASDTKAIFGKKAFLFEAMKLFPRERLKTKTLYFDSEEYTSEAETVMYYISNVGGLAGNKTLFSEADINDGRLNVAIFQKPSILLFGSLFWKFLRGQPIDHPKFKSFSTRRIKIRNMSTAPMPVIFDGEMFGTLPIEVECIPKAIKIIVP